MAKPFRKTPRNYNGTRVTSHSIGEVLPSVLARIGELHKDRPDFIIAAWPQIIGTKLAAMTEAVSFNNGVLEVKVKNSTLHSLLNQNDKPRLLMALRRRFPKVDIYNIMFRIG